MNTSDTIKDICGSVNQRPKESPELSCKKCKLNNHEDCVHFGKNSNVIICSKFTEKTMKDQELEEECRLARERGKAVCVWKVSRSDFQGQTECGNNVSHDSRFVFCPFCQKPIKVKT